MKRLSWKKYLPHVVAILIFLVLSMTYFYPVFFENKDLIQSDIVSTQGWGKELHDYHVKTGEYAFWSNSMFGGMPANYSYMPRTNNLFDHLTNIITLNLPPLHAGVFFLYMLGFYIFLMAMGCNPWIGIIGAVAYALSSYNLIILEAGHVNKGLVMATMAPVLGGIILCYRRKWIPGTFITLLFTGLNVLWNHQQVSYYLLLVIVLLAIVYFIQALKDHTVPDFFKSSILLLLTALFAIAPAADRLIPTADYAKETMRGGNVLKSNASGKAEQSGLDVSYAFEWSYGRLETMTLLIPNFYGGNSHYTLGKESETYQVLKPTGQADNFIKQAPMYWGNQPFTSGPVYVGAIICFLFILGLFMVKGPEKWWLLAATILSILLSWGKNLAFFNDFLFYHLPLYNKFRAPSTALIIASVTMVMLGMLAIKELIQAPNKKQWIRPLYLSAGITAGLCLFFALFGGSLFSFASQTDAQYQFPDWLTTALVKDRKRMLTSDAWRSFWLIILSAGVLWLYLQQKIKQTHLFLLLGLLIVLDLWTVDKRFLNKDDFVPKREAKQIQPTKEDLMILQDKDPDYRVLNLAANTFNESRTSYFHKSIGGYSPVKLRRYQDIIDYYLSDRGINMNVLNMLNTKYFIIPTEQGTTVQANPGALGNAWFIDSIQWVNSPDEEIEALAHFNPSRTAVIDKQWKEKVNLPVSQATDTTAKIRLVSYTPGKLVYEALTPQDRLAVFSEVFYKTWQATIDSQPATPVRVNYILRGLPVPKGKHTIEFTCVDSLYQKSARISLYASIATGIILLLLLGFLIRDELKKPAC